MTTTTQLAIFRLSLRCVPCPTVTVFLSSTVLLLMERGLCAGRQIVGIYSGTAVGALVATGLLGLRHLSPIQGNQETPCAGESRQKAFLVPIILLPRS